MAGEEKNNKIVMVNSFKGGAGKTTAALCRCVSEYKEKTYQNIYYVDLDILGTGVEYILSLKEQTLYYNDVDDGKRNRLQNKVQEIMRSGGSCLYAAVLNPLSRLKEAYGSQDRLRSHPDVERGVFRKKVKELLNQMLNMKGKNLIVLDCAPGISYTEECILADIYRMRDNAKKNVDVEEIYITTPDASHIKKTVSNLNTYSAYLKEQKRVVILLVNDLFNCEGMDRRGKEENDDRFLFNKEEIIKDIESRFDLPSLKILYLPYREDLLKKNIIKNESKLVNRPDDYNVWPMEYKVEKKQS